MSSPSSSSFQWSSNESVKSFLEQDYHSALKSARMSLSAMNDFDHDHDHDQQQEDRRGKLVLIAIRSITHLHLQSPRLQSSSSSSSSSVMLLLSDLLTATYRSLPSVPAYLILETLIQLLNCGEAKPARDLLELWLACSPEIESTLIPLQSSLYERLIEVYLLHILPQLGDLDFALTFLHSNTLLSPQRAKAFELALLSLKGHASGSPTPTPPLKGRVTQIAPEPSEKEDTHHQPPRGSTSGQKTIPRSTEATSIDPSPSSAVLSNQSPKVNQIQTGLSPQILKVAGGSALVCLALLLWLLQKPKGPKVSLPRPAAAAAASVRSTPLEGLAATVMAQLTQIFKMAFTINRV